MVSSWDSLVYRWVGTPTGRLFSKSALGMTEMHDSTAMTVPFAKLLAFLQKAITLFRVEWSLFPLNSTSWRIL